MEEYLLWSTDGYRPDQTEPAKIYRGPFGNFMSYTLTQYVNGEPSASMVFLYDVDTERITYRLEEKMALPVDSVFTIDPNRSIDPICYIEFGYVLMDWPEGAEVTEIVNRYLIEKGSE